MRGRWLEDQSLHNSDDAVMDPLIYNDVLAPALVATLPGWWACSKGHAVLGVALVCVGLVLVGPLSWGMLSIAIVSHGALPARAVIWAVVLLFCVVGGGIVLAVGPPKRRRLDRAPRALSDRNG